MMAILRIFQITIGRAAAYKLTVQHGLMLLGPNFLSDVQGVGFIDHVFQGKHNPAMALVLIGCVKLIGDGDKADMMAKEILLNVIAGVNEIPAQTGKVFHHHAVKITTFNIY